MGVWLEGWTGDLAGKLPGRKPNQLLVTFTGDSVELITADVWASNNDIYPGLTWYYNIDLSIATPDVGWPIAVGIQQLIGWNHTWAIDIANADGQQYGEWTSG